MKSWVRRFLLAMALTSPSGAFAQLQSQFDDIKFVEGELDKAESSMEKTDRTLPQVPDKVHAPKAHTDTKANLEYSAIDQARPFSELAVVQKTLLPKSSRWYYSVGGSMIPNDVFYSTLGGNLNLGYFLNETWGIELQALLLTSTKSLYLQELQTTQNVTVTNLVSMQSCYSAQIVWVPFYGKTTLHNRAIYPFEIFLTGGIGQVATQATQSAVAASFGFGEIFALDKNNSVRLDLKYLTYSSVNILGQTQTVGSFVLSADFQQFITAWRGR